MKKRHEQKLVILAIVLAVLFNVPVLMVYNVDGVLFGFPVFYVSVFIIWLFSVVVSYIILNRHYE